MDKIQIYSNSWINFPRKIKSYYLNSEISHGAYLTYLHLRLNSNPFGITIISLDDIRSDVFKNKVTKNSVNKYILELKNQKLIWFEQRRGSRGSFEIRHEEFFLPDGNITNLQKYFDNLQLVDTENNNTNLSELDRINQNSQALDEITMRGKNAPEYFSKVTTPNKDKNKEKDNINTVVKSTFKEESYKCKNPIESYKPTSYEEKQICEFLKELGVSCLDFATSQFRAGNMWAFEKAIIEFKETVIETGRNIEDPAGYYFGIVKRLLTEKMKLKIGRPNSI